VALLADPYLLLSFCLVNVRDAVESRVDHFGILLVRVAIRFCGCARWGLSILNKLPIVPEMVNNWKGGDHCNLLSQHFQLLFAQRIFQSLARLVDAVIFLDMVNTEDDQNTPRTP
jgi:hypothetical protein